MPVLASICGATEQVMDVHLMIKEPIRYIEDFKKAGADLITIHLEACEDVHATIAKIRECGMKAGLSICPETDTEELGAVFKEIDDGTDHECASGIRGDKALFRSPFPRSAGPDK